jgi:hypothetical protein
LRCATLSALGGVAVAAAVAIAVGMPVEGRPPDSAATGLLYESHGGSPPASPDGTAGTARAKAEAF